MKLFRILLGLALPMNMACAASPTPTPVETKPKSADVAATTAAPTAPTATTSPAAPTKADSSGVAADKPSGTASSNIPSGCGKVWQSVVGSGNPEEWDEAGSFEPGMEAWLGLWTDGQPGKCDYALAFVEVNRRVHVWFSPCEAMFTSLSSPALSKNGFGVEGNMGGSAARVALQLALSGPERAQGTLAFILPPGAELASGEKKVTFTRVCH